MSLSRLPVRQAPPPLVDKDNNLVALWSPKSACTAVYVWFASVCGFLDEVRDYHPFPHFHRVSKFNRSQRYRKSCRAYESTFDVVRVIRDPYQRTASIYRHARKTGFANRAISSLPKEFSLLEFLQALDGRDLRTLDTHCWPQRHPLEAVRTPDAVINVSRQNLFDELNAFAQARGLLQTDFAALDWYNKLEKRRATHSKLSYSDLLTPEARRLIERIYAEDFEAYQAFL